MGGMEQRIEAAAQYLEAELEEMFGLVERAHTEGDVTFSEANEAKQVGLQALRLYTQTSAESPSLLPHWLTEDGLTLALVVARFAAYGACLAYMSEADSIEKLVADTRALALDEGEEE